MPKVFSSGDLRERIDVQEDNGTTTLAVKTANWEDVAGLTTIPAHIRFETESERVRAGRNEARESIIVTVRAEITITPENRIKWVSSADEIYQVAGFAETIDQRRRWKQFPAVRTDAQ